MAIEYVIISHNEWWRQLARIPYFSSFITDSDTQTIKCFYCETNNTVLNRNQTCKCCNGSLQDGYIFVGTIFGILIYSLDDGIEAMPDTGDKEFIKLILSRRRVEPN